MKSLFLYEIVFSLNSQNGCYSIDSIDCLLAVSMDCLSAVYSVNSELSLCYNIVSSNRRVLMMVMVIGQGHLVLCLRFLGFRASVRAGVGVRS